MLEVVDLSSNQPHPISYGLLPVDAGIIKATEGTFYVNQYCAQDVNGLRKAKKIAAVYHFLHANESIPAQIALLRANLNGVRMVVIDSELNHLGVADWNMTPAEWQIVATTTHQALDLAKSLPSVRTVMLYSSPGFIQNLPGAPWGYPLWLADYGVENPPPCNLWQFTSTACVAGVGGDVDLSYFKGTPAQLDKLFGLSLPKRVVQKIKRVIKKKPVVTPDGYALAHGMSQIDHAEAYRAIEHGVSYYTFAHEAMHGSRSRQIPTGTLYAFTSSLTKYKIPHAGG